MNKERRKLLMDAKQLLLNIKSDFEQARELIGQAADEEREYYDNMSENLQGSEKGRRAYEVADNLDQICSDIDNTNIESIIYGLDEAVT